MDDLHEDDERDDPPAAGGLRASDPEEAVRPALAAATGMFGLGGAALVLVDPGGELAWAVAAGRLAGELEAAAQPLWSGPGREVMAAGTWVATDDLRREARWPQLAGAPGLRSVRTLMCIPVKLVGGSAGAFTAVRTARRLFGVRETAAIVAYAGVVATLARLAAVASSQAQIVEQLEHALRHRVVIEQAKGILMEREGIEPAAAFDRLRQAARASRRRVSEVAEQVVAGHPLEEPPEDGPA
jgi:hypothetical protein